jgi:hypothetical protein
MGFTWKDFLAGASGSLGQGAQIGLGGMAEMQRRQEEAQANRRQAELDAFNRQTQNRQFENQDRAFNYGQEQDAINRQDTNYNNQQDAIYRDTTYRMGLENQVKQNSFEQQRIDLSKQIGQAQIQNYQEPNNRYSAGVGGGGVGQQQGFDPETAAKLAQQDGYKMAQMVDEYGDPTGQVDPVKFDAIVKQRFQFYSTFNPGDNAMPQLPQGGAEIINSIFNGNGHPQNQPQRLVGGQPQPMQQSSANIHPALQKMAQDGVSKQAILSDYMANPQEYESQGITLDMIGALAQ